MSLLDSLRQDFFEKDCVTLESLRNFKEGLEFFATPMRVHISNKHRLCIPILFTPTTRFVPFLRFDKASFGSLPSFPFQTLNTFKVAACVVKRGIAFLRDTAVKNGKFSGGSECRKCVKGVESYEEFCLCGNMNVLRDIGGTWFI